ncbi:MAG: flagellar hook-basal body complex protein FliE [Elusimicrobia bacterium RIFOXYB2_FULL_49_7]|nr:MAG: flagellar hook-basal body complex protein FliE [Elusimicrobia bacterium RIFOXYB2_FULL_49_7]
MADLNNSILGIDKLSRLSEPGKQKTVINDPSAPSFTDTLQGFIKDVNSMQNHADRSIEKMVAGEITDVHQVMVAVEEANTAFSLMTELRNKMLDAYQEIMRMQV